MTRILLVTQDDSFLEELKSGLGIVDGSIAFTNKYYQATVPVSFSLNPSDAIGCEAIVVHAAAGIDFIRYFNAAQDAAIRILVTTNTAHSQWCADNGVELFDWTEEDGFSPDKRLLAALECHPWASPGDDSDSSSIDFEELTSEIRSVRENSKLLSDEERREAAAKTALKLLKYFDLSEDDDTPRVRT